MSVPAQIAVLLALTTELFGRVPLDQMTDAEHAVHDAAAKIPAEVCARLETVDKLSDENRKTIIEIARQALARFQPKPEPKPAPKPESKTKPKVETESEPKAKAEPKPEANPKPDGWSKPDAPTDAKLKPKPETKPEFKTGTKKKL